MGGRNARWTHSVLGMAELELVVEEARWGGGGSLFFFLYLNTPCFQKLLVS